MSKRAVLLLNLGSPRSCATGDVRDYLREFLGDPCVLDMPAPLRWLLLNGVILRKRPARSAEAYRRVWLPNGSPLIVHTEALRAALEQKLNVAAGAVNGAEHFPVFAGMRYGEPSVAAAAREVLRRGITDVFVVPQYPHFAMSSYGTAVAHAKTVFAEIAPAAALRVMPPFYAETGYVAALVESARSWLAAGDFDSLLFSFHGIPLRHLRREISGYPDCAEPRDVASPEPEKRARDYRHQCFATMEAFCALAKIEPARRTISFQSRLGAGEWLKPYTDATLRTLPARGVRRLLVICPAFTADCLETLDEIRNEGRETFLAAGGVSFEQIPCLNSHPAYVDFLAEKALQAFR